MGVNGLWTVVQPCARPTNLATLNRKRLAVDASIWIYQFLKAVRDKEGNALRNSHVVGFFRRICKLLWFGIQPVFVFDGGAPALKRATIQARNRRREGRREDAVKTAGKLLAVQMQRLAEEEQEKRKTERDPDITIREEALQQEELPDMNNVIYAAELQMTQPERQQVRKFRKQDAYHLPELDGGMAGMGKPDDPRIMSVEELEEYARQFNNGEDINLYDFSKIDFDGDFFKSLPPPDRYNILNAARLRSRLRMGLSKEQLDDMFPDRMAFSRFQIERVKERNHLTQRLMYEVGMTGTDLTLGVNARVAGEKDREYILVKNEGVEGGWALGVVSKEKDVGEAHKPIDVDAIEIQYQSKDAQDEDDSDDFEDVPIEGLNRLPKPSASAIASMQAAQEIAEQRQQFYGGPREQDATDENQEGSLFVGGNTETIPDPSEDQPGSAPLHPEEEDDLNFAIALSLHNQHGVGQQESEEEFEDVPMPEPEWKQQSAEVARPITGRGGSAIAHVVNMRANAAVPKKQPEKVADDSDSDEDLQAVLAKARKTRKQQPKPVLENRKNPFDGPLPFPKLDLGLSLFAKKGSANSKPSQPKEAPIEHQDEDGDDEMAGGFERPDDEGPKPLPPWLADDTDIRESIKKQQNIERHINAEDKEEAEEEQRMRRREMRDSMIEIESSSDDESTVEVLEYPPQPKRHPEKVQFSTNPQNATNTTPGHESSEASEAAMAPRSNSQAAPEASSEPASEMPERSPIITSDALEDTLKSDGKASASPEPVFEDVEVPQKHQSEKSPAMANDSAESPEPQFEDVLPTATFTIETNQAVTEGLQSDLVTDIQQADPADQRMIDDDALFEDVEYDEFSEPEDEELMVQMAEEAEEHARFTRELNNNKSTLQSREDYEKELRQLRNQQKKDRRDADEVTQVMVTECQALLRLFGIPYVTAPMEAEAQCAELVELGLVDGIVTDDSDTFLFGGNRVYKNMFSNSKYVECYLSTDLEKELSLSREQLISLAHLLGSDYTEGLSGVGPVTAVEILSEFPGKSGLENFREWWLAVQSQARPKEADASSSIRKKFRKSHATKLFLPSGFPNPAVYDAYLHPEVDDSAEPFQWGVPDLEGLRRFLMATIGWTKERTDEVLVPVIKDMNKRGVEGTQSNITRFFGGPVGVGAKEAFAPRQRAQGSKRLAAAVDNLRANVAGESSAVSQQAAGTRKRRASKDVVADDDVDQAQDVYRDSKGKAQKGKKRAAAS